MKYKCLVVDHDDTIVNSTATIHYPAFLAFMREVRPSISMSLEEYFAYNFEPGVVPLFRDICALNPEEMRQEEAFWHEYVKDHIPQAYPGIDQLLWQQKKEGGLICVVSHSFSTYIKRDYAHNHLPEPDMIFGWDLEPALRKPSPWALQEIMRKCRLAPDELLVIDDLKPGYDMAAAAGVPFAAAGWATDVQSIETFMRRNCPLYFKTVEALAAYLR